MMGRSCRGPSAPCATRSRCRFCTATPDAPAPCPFRPHAPPMDNDDFPAPAEGGSDLASPPPPAPEVPMGQPMPETQRVPTLLPRMQAVASPPAGELRVSTLGSGLSFVGKARIDGSLTVAGEVQGNIELEGNGSGHV